MTTRIKLRRDTSANWATSNPILAQGEPGLDTTLNQIKYGDGTTHWLDLEFASGGGTTNGNLDLSRDTQGYVTLERIPSTTGGYNYRDTAVYASGNVYTVGGFYSNYASSDIGLNHSALAFTVYSANGTVIANRLIYQDSQPSWSYGGTITVNPITGNIVVVGDHYLGGGSKPARHEISSDLTSVTSAYYTFTDNPWSYTVHSAVLPDGSTVAVGGHSSTNDLVNYSNVQAHPGSYTSYLGLDIAATFGSNSLPTINNGWYITGYNAGSGQDVTAINSFDISNPDSSGSGINSTWTITYTPTSNVYVISSFTGGTGYVHGEIVHINGNELGGNITTNDLNITVGNISNVGAIVNYTISGHAQTDLIWLHEDSGIDFGTLPAGEQWNVLQSTGDNIWVTTDDWAVTIGGSSGDNPRTVATDTGGNIYVGGQMYSGIGLRPDNQEAGIVKLSPAGDKVWTKFVDFDRYNNVHGLGMSPAGKLVAAVMTNNDYLAVVKINPADGSIYWTTTIGTAAQNTGGDPMGFYHLTNPVFDGTGNIIVAGSFGSIDSNGDDLFIASLNPTTGAVNWQRAISAPNNQYLRWNNDSDALACDGTNYYLTFNSNYNGDAGTHLIKLPVDGTDPVDMTHNWLYQTQTWTTHTLTPTAVNDIGDVIDVTKFTPTPNTMATALLDITGYLDSSKTTLLKGSGAEILGVRQINFEDGSTQSTAIVSAQSKFAGTNYFPMEIQVYNGGINFNWNGSDDVLWFDSANAQGAIDGLYVVGAIIEYQLYCDSRYGVQIGTIHVSSFYDQSGEAAHTEHWTADGTNMMYNQPWIIGYSDYNRVNLYYRGQSGASSDIKIQWTARVFYGQENYC